jgi:hypothetical protein
VYASATCERYFAYSEKDIRNEVYDSWLTGLEPKEQQPHYYGNIDSEGMSTGLEFTSHYSGGILDTENEMGLALEAFN